MRGGIARRTDLPSHATATYRLMCRLPTIIPQPEKHDLRLARRLPATSRDVKSRVSDRWQTCSVHLLFRLYRVVSCDLDQVRGQPHARTQICGLRTEDDTCGVVNISVRLFRARSRCFANPALTCSLERWWKNAHSITKLRCFSVASVQRATYAGFFKISSCR